MPRDEAAAAGRRRAPQTAWTGRAALAVGSPGSKKIAARPWARREAARVWFYGGARRGTPRAGVCRLVSRPFGRSATRAATGTVGAAWALREGASAVGARLAEGAPARAGVFARRGLSGAKFGILLECRRVRARLGARSGRRQRASQGASDLNADRLPSRVGSAGDGEGVPVGLACRRPRTARRRPCDPSAQGLFAHPAGGRQCCGQAVPGAAEKGRGAASEPGVTDRCGQTGTGRDRVSDPGRRDERSEVGRRQLVVAPLKSPSQLRGAIAAAVPKVPGPRAAAVPKVPDPSRCDSGSLSLESALKAPESLEGGAAAARVRRAAAPRAPGGSQDDRRPP